MYVATSSQDRIICCGIIKNVKTADALSAITLPALGRMLNGTKKCIKIQMLAAAHILVVSSCMINV